MAGEGGGGGFPLDPRPLIKILGDLFSSPSRSGQRDADAVRRIEAAGVENASQSDLERIALSVSSGGINFALPQSFIDAITGQLTKRSVRAEFESRPPTVFEQGPFVAGTRESLLQPPTSLGFAESGGGVDVGAQAQVLAGGGQVQNASIFTVLFWLDRLFRNLGFGPFRQPDPFPRGTFPRPGSIPPSQLPPAPGGTPPGPTTSPRQTAGPTIQQGGVSMPSFPVALGGDVVTPFFGSGPGFDIGDVFGPNSVLNRFLFPESAPTVPGPVPQIPGQVPGGGNGFAASGGAGCPTSPFRGGGRTTATAVPFVAVNPVSGRPVWFGPLGRPLLWTGDMRACKRVKRIATRAARSTRRRRSGG